MFKVILLCLLTCCSSMLPQRDNSSCINVDDNTQVVEKKTKENYFSEERYICIYSLNQFASDSYWRNIFQDISNLEYANYIALGGTQDVTYNELLNGTNYWSANATTLSSTSIYYCATNGYLTQVTGGDFNVGLLKFERIAFTENVYDFRLTIYLNDNISHNTNEIIYNARICSDTNFYGVSTKCSVNMNGSYCIGLPKSRCFLTAYAEESYDKGYLDGKDVGYDEGKYIGDAQGYIRGFNDGYDIAMTGGESGIIFTGILDVASIPVNVFLQMFNYDILGVNIAGLVSALITLCMIMILIRFITGRRV